ncbi:hypothetical protein CEXT_642161 [Caerostris extrusa]|uniref:Uncharacterized protein n=1 Tax=Caerostris extrusa TaxID=172846 RepID=A0AAV4WDZ5_CAEEX|nr:hypothetical protein CEXT_642161 [Caerostris extrusa]
MTNLRALDASERSLYNCFGVGKGVEKENGRKRRTHLLQSPLKIPGVPIVDTACEGDSLNRQKYAGLEIRGMLIMPVSCLPNNLVIKCKYN